MKKSFSIIIIYLLGCNAIHAQTAQEIDNKVAAYLQHIRDLSSSNADQSDSIGAVNDLLSTYMQQVLVKKAALTASFSKAQKSGLDVFTANDKKVRFYSWDTWTGGTMHFFSDVAQYQAGDNVKMLSLNDTAAEGDPGCFYSGITTVHTKDNKTVYLVNYGIIGSTKDKGAGITAYSVQGGKLKKLPFFQIKAKMVSEIEYGYDEFASNITDSGFPLIHFNKDKSKLYIPIVKKDGNFTKGYLVYVFDNYKFVFDKNAKE